MPSKEGVKRKKVYELLGLPRSVVERSRRTRVKESGLAKIPRDVWLYRINRLPAWIRNHIQDSMGRTGAETVAELADLRWQRDASDQAHRRAREGVEASEGSKAALIRHLTLDEMK